MIIIIIFVNCAVLHVSVSFFRWVVLIISKAKFPQLEQPSSLVIQSKKTFCCQINSSLSFILKNTYSSRILPLIMSTTATSTNELALLDKSVVVSPLVLLSVVDHYNRVAKDSKKSCWGNIRR